MKKLIIGLLIISLLLVAASSLNIRRLTFKNKAGEPVYLELQGLSYNYKTGEYEQPAWGQYYYLTNNPASYIDQDGMIVYLDEESLHVWTIIKDRYIINVIYEQEKHFDAALNANPVCASNVVEKPDGYIGVAAYYDMEHNTKLSVVKCQRLPANRGDPETQVFKWRRVWFMKRK